MPIRSDFVQVHDAEHQNMLGRDGCIERRAVETDGVLVGVGFCTLREVVEAFGSLITHS